MNNFNLTHPLQKICRREKGQNILEFALVLPFLMVILFGVLDLGRVYFSMITLTSSAREGARYLTLHSDDISNPLGVFRDTKLIAVKEANYAGINISTDQVSVTCVNVDDEPNNCDGGKPAVITITQNFELILGWVLPSPIKITRTAEMMVP